LVVNAARCDTAAILFSTILPPTTRMQSGDVVMFASVTDAITVAFEDDE
jgi:hypothetical protein